MTTKSSIASVMAWNWLVQSLAIFKQVDPSTLAGVVKKAPAVSDDLENDSREMVSLKMLESLFIHDNEAKIDTLSTQNPKFSFDPSEHCEDVLNRILEEASEPMTELERQKWNVRPFLMHKRASLPKSSLQKLKEELLEGSHPLLESLKERSNLGGTNVPENSQNTCPEVNVDLNDQTTVSKDDLVSMNPAKSNKLPKSPLHKSDHVDNSTSRIAKLIKRKEHKVSKEPPVKSLEDNIIMDHNEQTPSKNLEHSYGNGNLDDHGQQELTSHDDDDDHVPNDSKRKEHEMSKEPPVKGLEENMLMDHNEPTPSKNLEHSYEKGNVDHGQQELTGQAAADDDHVPNVSKSGPSDENIESERSDDEMIDIAAKKEAFLNSQFTLSQDSMATIDSIEISLCMKCSKGGTLLVCSSDTCQVRVHETCLGLTTTLDEKGNFFCPFCAYSRAISEYLEVKKKASLARKGLQAFIGSRVKHRPKISSKKGAVFDKRKSTQTEKVKVNGNGHTVSRGKEDSVPNEHVDKHVNDEFLNQHKRKFNEKESHVSSRSRRCREQKPQYTSPTIPLVGRTKLQWTKLEVEILKEGVQRFSSNDNKGTPWRDILDFGRDVFNKSRTTIDLKDKWRNICKGSPSKKKPKL